MVGKNMIGKYVIVRGDRSGVFAGVLKERDGKEACLTGCRRIWSWSGAASISQIATEGVKRPNECKFTVTVEEIIITDAIEVIPCTANSEKCIKEVLEWRM